MSEGLYPSTDLYPSASLYPNGELNAVSGRIMTERGLALLEQYPPFLRKAHLIRAICNAAGAEFAIRDERIAILERDTIPSSALGLLEFYEDMLGLPRQPNETVIARKDRILAFMSRAGITGSGVDWRRIAAIILGEGWTYEVIDPNNSVLIVKMALVQGTMAAELAESLLRSITPAAMRLDVTYGGGFILDQSRLDEDIL